MYESFFGYRYNSHLGVCFNFMYPQKSHVTFGAQVETQEINGKPGQNVNKDDAKVVILLQAVSQSMPSGCVWLGMNIEDTIQLNRKHGGQDKFFLLFPLSSPNIQVHWEKGKLTICYPLLSFQRYKSLLYPNTWLQDEHAKIFLSSAYFVSRFLFLFECKQEIVF